MKEDSGNLQETAEQRRDRTFEVVDHFLKAVAMIGISGYVFFKAFEVLAADSILTPVLGLLMIIGVLPVFLFGVYALVVVIVDAENLIAPWFGRSPDRPLPDWIGWVYSVLITVIIIGLFCSQIGPLSSG